MRDPDRIMLSAFLISAAVGVVACVVLASLRIRSRQPALRGVILSATIVVLVATPALYDWLILRLTGTQGLQRVYIDLSPLSLSAPSLLSLLAFLAVTTMRPPRLGG